MVADLILHNAVVRTMDAAGTVAEAVAIEADRIVAAGVARELAARFAGPTTRLCDLSGRTVLPGFIDAHVHFELTALSLAQSVDCHLR
jgi:predicted amidohydrolase YtcJ